MISRELIDELSWEIVELYERCENNLLRLIIKQAKRGADLTGERLEWDMTKLRDLGGLTKKAIAEIAQTSKKARDQLPKILLEIAKEAIAKDGLEGGMTDGIFRAVQALQSQATENLNLVGTVMLSGTQTSFNQFVNMLTNERNRILSEKAVGLVTGTSTFEESVASAIKQMSREGITAFQDRAGRSWSPEGYVSMDMRTTSANVARKAVEAQANDFNLHVFQVSSHAGARPKCERYQGHFYSDNQTYGKITDAYGEEHEYEPVENTSYGQPDGLFGINCGHDRIYVSEGFYNRRKPLTEEQLEENRKTYERSQQQRAIERKIRRSEREAENLKEAGYKGFSDIAKGQANKAKDEYRAFCSETGRTPRWSRTKIY